MPETERVKMSLPLLMEKKRKKQKITMITSYTVWQAALVDQAGIDIVLVGDSLSMTELGNPTTLPVTMETMLAHASAVTRGCKYGFVLGDMPYMSYQPSNEIAVKNAGRFMAESACDGVKLEGGLAMADRVRAIAEAGIPVMGHLGLTPQSMSALGGFKAQGKDAVQAKRVTDDAVVLEEAGAFAILLECVPAKVSKLITERAKIPIISIGAGPDCDGQALIFHDMFNLFAAFTPKFAKRYGDVAQVIREGLAHYVEEVRTGAFPAPQHTFGIPDEQFAELLKLLAADHSQ
jgi:3-methyl-2-oxobutanoate hydroxymethyltransferase